MRLKPFGSWACFICFCWCWSAAVLALIRALSIFRVTSDEKTGDVDDELGTGCFQVWSISSSLRRIWGSTLEYAPMNVAYRSRWKKRVYGVPTFFATESSRYSAGSFLAGAACHGGEEISNLDAHGSQTQNICKTQRPGRYRVSWQVKNRERIRVISQHTRECEASQTYNTDRSIRKFRRLTLLMCSSMDRAIACAA